MESISIPFLSTRTMTQRVCSASKKTTLFVSISTHFRSCLLNRYLAKFLVREESERSSTRTKVLIPSFGSVARFTNQEHIFLLPSHWSLTFTWEWWFRTQSKGIYLSEKAKIMDISRAFAEEKFVNKDFFDFSQRLLHKWSRRRPRKRHGSSS